MNPHLNHTEDDMNDYPFHPVGSGAHHLHWAQEHLYTQPSNQVHSVSPYTMPHPQPVAQRPWTMEPAHPNTEYQLSSAHLGRNITHDGSPYSTSGRNPHQIDHPPLLYSPASSGGSYASPLYRHAPEPSNSGTIPLPPRRGSPQVSASLPAIDGSLPEEVRNAMQAAYASVEWSSGANVPAEILMPTVQKLAKDSWGCRICGKEHKRRDHTLTHVRTAHLDNKGFRCHFDDCDSAFGRKGDLERHISSTHQGAYEAVCPHCNSQLHRKDNLTRHIKTCKMVGVSSASSSRSARRHDSSLAYPAPYPTPSSRRHRHHNSTTYLPQTQPSLIDFHFPSDPVYEHLGLGLLNTGSTMIPQAWYSDSTPYAYSTYELPGTATTGPWWA